MLELIYISRQRQLHEVVEIVSGFAVSFTKGEILESDDQHKTDLHLEIWQLHKVLKDEGTKRILHWHLSQSYKLTYVQYKVQGKHRAGGGAVRAFAPTFHEIQIMSFAI